MSDLKFASREVDRLIAYLQANPQVSDVLFTGGDPLIMSARNLAQYIEPLLEADLPNLRRIRIGSKALSFWPYRFLTDDDSDDFRPPGKKLNTHRNPLISQIFHRLLDIPQL